MGKKGPVEGHQAEYIADHREVLVREEQDRGPVQLRAPEACHFAVEVDGCVVEEQNCEGRNESVSVRVAQVALLRVSSKTNFSGKTYRQTR